MPEFCDSLPESSYNNAFPIVRTPSRGRLIATVTSLRLTCAPVHYYRGRTVPHNANGECAACEGQRAYRWLAWVACVPAGATEQVVFETTASAARAFEKYYLASGTLRGARFLALRPSGRPTGRIQLTVRPGSDNAAELPSCPDLVKVLTHIWASNQDTPTPVQKRTPQKLRNELADAVAAQTPHSQNGR